jgi:hypothetical protein
MIKTNRRAAGPNRYRGVVLGLLGGLAGTLAMGQYWTRVAPLVSGPAEAEAQPPKHDAHSIALFGQQHQPGESSTAALGRIAYRAVRGQAPGEQTATALSEAVHWGTGLLSGALYGALLARTGGTALTGATFGAALWAGNDEGLVPLLGLQDGPSAGNLRGHANRLGAHLSFGLGLGLSVWALGRVLPAE